MGCQQSTIENDESVVRCKERKLLMKSAVISRNAFAAAQSSYSMALKNTGAALSDYAEGEIHVIRPPSAALPSSSAAQTTFPSSSSAVSSPSTVQPPADTLPPPPPPLPADLSSAPIQRSASMPGLSISMIRRKQSAQKAAIIEEDDQETIDESDAGAFGTRSATPPAPTDPQPLSQNLNSNENSWDYFNLFNTDHTPAPSLVQQEEVVIDKDAVKISLAETRSTPEMATEIPDKAVVEPPLPQQQKTARKAKQAGASSNHHRTLSSGSESKRGKMVDAAPQSVSFLQILNKLDDHFLKAHEMAHEVSKMLEATRMHYHSNFADNRGHIDHSEKVLKVITWNRSIKGIKSEDNSKDDFDDEKWETHATVLDKMLAWEKKLYDEVKAGEVMKSEYQKKVRLFNKQKKRGMGPESLQKVEAAVSQLHTRCIVDMQSMDSTISEINSLRDHKLYPRLVELVNGMAIMWEAMHFHHSNQHNLVAGLRSCNISLAARETSEQHHETTIQLCQIAREWHSQFQNLMARQKEYVKALTSWLRLNIIPIESTLKEKISSPPNQTKPPIRDLLTAWHDQLEKLPDDRAKAAIFSFSEVVNTIVILQEDELKLKEICEETRKEFARKKRSFEEWRRRNAEKRAGSSAREAEEGGGEASAAEKELLEERTFAVESVEIRLKSEEETYQRTCKQVREKSVGSLRNKLPELFHAMSEFSHTCSEMYKHLKVISQSEKTMNAD